MSHKPNVLDIKTDLRRSVMASFSPKEFEDPNFKVFLINAQNNLERLKVEIGRSKYTEIKKRLSKAFDSQKSIEKRREDILTASSLI